MKTLTLAMLLLAVSSFAAEREIPPEIQYEANPWSAGLRMPARELLAGDSCVLFRHVPDDDTVGFSSGYQIGDRTVTYFDPEACTSPAAPFRITGFSFTLFDPPQDPRTYKWPVELDVVVFDVLNGDNCDGPGTELCRLSLVCDSATYAFPNIATVAFPDSCCVDGPFFIGVEYTDAGTGPFPSVLFDSESSPDPCHCFQYVCCSFWIGWYAYWVTPPGYPFFWVHGEPMSLACCDDIDTDSICDIADNCPGVANNDQADGDGDGIGDACDNCPALASADQTDTDSDNVGDLCDNCPDDANIGQSDSDSDGLGDICDNCPNDANPGQQDLEGDGLGDVCDPDDDDDGVPDVSDNCPALANPLQEDGNTNGIGDVCEFCCLGRTGDLDLSRNDPAEIDSVDLGLLVNFLFSPPGTVQLPCEPEADVDAGGGPNPIDSSDLGVLISYLFSPPGSVTLPTCP